jgi:hypothetical protein
MLQELSEEVDLNSIDKAHLLIVDKIGVIADAIG